MSIQEKLASLFTTTNYVVMRQTEGLTNADSLIQPPFRGNCLNWVLGHIIVSRDDLLQVLGASRIQDGAVRALYETDSSPITAESPAMPLPELLAELTRSQLRLAEILRQKSIDELSAFIDQERNQTLEDRLRGFHWHETLHAGALELLRQLAGKEDQIF